MICQRCTKDVAAEGIHTCTPSALVRKLEEHRDALLIDLAASLGREDALRKDAERYRWILHQAKITDFIFAYTKSDERHVSNAIDDAMKGEV